MNDDEPLTLIDAVVLMQAGLALAGHLYARGDKLQAARQLLDTVVRFQALVDPNDDGGSIRLCEELIRAGR